jgi:hypothetical protein
MRRIFALLIALVLGFGTLTSKAQAQQIAEPTSTLSAQVASQSATATPAANIQEKIEDKQEKDITQVVGPTKGRLARLLDERPVEKLGFTNWMQHLIRNANTQGVPVNILVLILLFPVIASFIAASRHVIGLEGFGIYTPAVLAVTFLSTGLISGILLFVAILAAATIGREILKRFKLQYLPRTALMLWAVSLSVFFLLVASPYLLPLGIDLVTLSIFPILVLILLSENFIEALLSGTQKRAVELTFETILLAALSAVFIRTDVVQEFVLFHPELMILVVLIANIAVGRYTGLRISEYFRFKPLLDTEE